MTDKIKDATLIMGVSVPIFVKSRDDHKVTFETDLKVQVNGGLDDEEKTPYLDIQLVREIELKNFKCAYEKVKCNQIQNDLTNTFAAKILTF